MIKVISSVASTPSDIHEWYELNFSFCCTPLCVFPSKKPPPRCTVKATLVSTYPLTCFPGKTCPPEAKHMIGAGEIRLTVNFQLCLLWEILLPNVWQECHREKNVTAAAAAPAELPALASDPSARPSSYKCFPSPPTAQPVNLPIQRFPLSPGKAHFPFPSAQSVSVTSA